MYLTTVPSLNYRPHIWKKKASLIVFRRKFYQNFCQWRIFSVPQSGLILKGSLELNPLIQNNVQQDYLITCFSLLTKRQQWGLESCLFFKKIGGKFFPQKRRDCSERIIYDCCLSLCL